MKHPQPFKALLCAASIGIALLCTAVGAAHADTSGEHFVYLPLLMRAGNSPTPSPSPSPTPGSRTTFFLQYLWDGDIWQSVRPQIAIDKAGGIHVAYGSRSGGAAFYGYCASNCVDLSHFQSVAMGGGTLGVAYLALTPAGHPRLLISDSANGNSSYRYAACDGNCTSLAGWAISGRLAESENHALRSSVEASQPFALDAQGRPRFVYSISLVNGTYETYLVRCDTDCTADGNWTQTKIADEYWDNLTLLISPQGLPRLAYVAKVQDAQGNYTDRLFYLECATASCATVAGSLEIQPFQGDGVFSMKLDSAGHPRIAENPGWDKVYFVSCDNNCTTSSQWVYQDIGLPDALDGKPLLQGKLGVTLALDASNRPRIAYHSGYIGELGYAWCNTGCSDSEANWRRDIIGSRAESEQELGKIRLRCDNCVPKLPDCKSDWDVGYWPEIALAANGDPRVVYESQLWTSGGCSAEAVARISRIAVFSQP